MTDDHTPRPDLIQVGPRYGVRDFMRSMDRSWDVGMQDAPWVAPASSCLKARLDVRRSAETIVRRMADGLVGSAMLSHEMCEGRRLGKPYVQIDGQFGVTLLLAQGERRDEAVSLIDCSIRVEGDRVVGTISPGRFMMTRHALERLYEREGVPTGGMPDAIRHTMADVRRSISFSTVADLTMGRIPGFGSLAADMAAPLGAIQLVPCSSGLLVVEVLVCLAALDDYPIVRLETRRSGTFSRGAPTYDPRIVRMEKDGAEFHVIPMHVGRTYLSWNMLRPEQREYAALFHGVEAGVDLAATAREVFGTRDAHRKEESAGRPPAPDVGRLQQLLPRCVNLSERNMGVWYLQPRITACT